MPIIADTSDTSGSFGPTLEDLVTDVVGAAQGLALAPDKLVTLSGAISSSALQMKLLGDVSPGVFEIGDELILVTAVEASSGTCTIHPRGRGWQGSTAAAHSAGDVVAEGPALPRHRARSWINDVISSMYPTVFGVATATGSLDSVMFETTSDAEEILDVRVLDDDGDWQRVRHWEAEAASAAATAGRVVRIPTVCLGRTVQVVFSVRPEQLSGLDQQWSDTGLSLALKDVVVTGVLAKFAKTLDIGRLSDRFSSPKGDAQQPQLGAGFAMARQLGAEFQAGLDREASALRRLYPPRTHFVR